MINFTAVDVEMRGGGCESGSHAPRQGEIPAFLPSVTRGLQDQASGEWEVGL